MNRTELREKLNKIDCENCNQYDLVNLFESVKLSNEDLNKLSEIVEDKDVHDFLYSKLNNYRQKVEKLIEEENTAKIEIRKEYSWYDVYINNTMILKHISKEDVDDIIDVLEKNNHPYIYKETESSRWADERRKAKETVEESMSPAVERQTNGYKKTKGQIQCNGGAQAKEVEDLLKAKYDNVTTQKGKGGKVIIKFSKNESLGESLSESEDIQSRIDELEERIQKLVKRYQSAQKQYHGDSSLSKRIEAEISGLEDEQRKLKSKLYTEESLSEAYKLLVRYKDKETNRTYSREYPYNGETDKKNIGWLKDADKIAFDNCAPNEDVLGYNLVEVGEDESLSEDTVKQGSQWVNKGKEGTHGKFKTKKAADAQRKAMFAKGFSVNESVDLNTLPDDYVLLDSRARNHTDKDIDLYYDCIKEFCMIDEIVYDDADDWDEETFNKDYTYTPDEESALECANDYLVKKYPDKITVGDIKKSADDVSEEVKSFFYEQAQKEAEEALNPSDFQEQLKEDKAKDTMKSVVAKWRSRRSNKSESVKDDSNKEKKNSKNIAGIEHL